MPSFEVPASMEPYLVSRETFFLQNPGYDRLVVGAIVFHEDKMVLVQRSATDIGFPNFWEIPGGMYEDTDQTILHAAVRELKEETGLKATKIVRRVGQLEWEETSRRTGKDQRWLKLIFEIEVEDMTVVLDPAEHQHYVLATEEEIRTGKTDGITLSFITPPNKEIKLEAFRLRRGEATLPAVYLSNLP